MDDLYAPLLDSPHERQGIGEMSEPTLRAIQPTPDTHESVLTEAQGLVHGDRNKAYGHPLHDYSRTAGMVNAMLAHKLKEPLTAEDLGLVMCCVKLSRQQNAPKRDNLVDLAGYAECVQWMIDERARLAGA
jgi:hypothetical protein